MNRQLQPLFGVFVSILAVALLGASSVPTLPVPKGAAMIFNPGNGDYSGFRIVVEPDGQAMAVDAAGRASNELRSDVAQRFFDDLAAAKTAESSGQACATSAGLPTTTLEVNAAISIAWNGHRWAGLNCTADASLSKLAIDAKAIEQALYVQAYRQRMIVVYVGNHSGYSAPSQGGYTYTGGYAGPMGGGYSSQPFTPSFGYGSSPYSGYPSGSMPSSSLPTTGIGGSLPTASLPTTSPFSGLPSASLPSSSPFGSSPFGSSPYGSGP